MRIITTARECEGKLFGFQHRGQYNITAVHNNGTGTIRRGNFDEHINICRLKKYKPNEITSAHNKKNENKK